MNNGRQKPINPPRIALVLLAAGGSTRMRGADKLLEKIDKSPLLRRAAREASKSAATRRIVVLRPHDRARSAVLAGFDVETLENPSWRNGMATSIALAVQSCKNEDAVLISLADMPDITARDYDRLITAFGTGQPDMICRASAEDGTPGHPVLFGRAYFAELTKLTGDSGARNILKHHASKVTTVPLKARHALTDLDTEGDFARYRKT